jgi:transcription initiation factor TFIIE subunit alpha
MLSDPLVLEILMDITDDEKDSLPIIECIIKGKKSDLEISEETEIKLNTVRKVLYKLNEAGIASYKKTQDPETKWYIYNWKFEQNNISAIITRKYTKLSEEIEKSIKYEKANMFFACKANGHRYKFEKASENNFECPKCGESLEHHDNSARIVELLNEKAANESLVNKSVNDQILLKINKGLK